MHIEGPSQAYEENKGTTDSTGALSILSDSPPQIQKLQHMTMRKEYTHDETYHIHLLVSRGIEPLVGVTVGGQTKENRTEYGF